MFQRVILVVLTLALLITLTGCSISRELDSIQITPSPGAQVLTAIGQTAQFKAIAIYSKDGAYAITRDVTSQVQWSSSAVSVGTIDNNGLATAIGFGDTTITASMNGSRGVIVGTSSLTVLP